MGRSRPDSLRDYTADSRIIYVSALAAGIGAVSAVAAWALLKMIALCTNLFYFHSWSLDEHDPWQSGIHWTSIFVPVLGGLIIGVIARFLSPKVRGHGMPEAVETIVFGGGRVQPRVAVLKPVATAVSIGSGGPFGAEGPVIITGGAIGSVLGQLLLMTESERRVLMVAGASAGMAATFNCPMSAILLAVEILLFEWKPRSVVPVAMACVTAGAVRRLLLGGAPLLAMVPSTRPVYHQQMIGALTVGVVAALFAAFLSKSIQFSEKMFHKLPIHWMWWPAIGGLFVGVGGLIFPQALGVGYSTLQEMVTTGRHTAWNVILGVLIVKTIIWVIALGSETAGGILAPTLLLGGALGAAMGHAFPASVVTGSWVLIGMTALLTAAIGSPLTSAMLALELTRNGGLMLPVLLACMSSYALSVLVQRRSLLTEGLSQRGFHLSREYSVDPLEIVLVSQAMHTSVFALSAAATRREAAAWLTAMEERGPGAWSHWQRLFPLLDEEGHMVAMLTRSQMMTSARAADLDVALLEDANRSAETMSPGDPLKKVANTMAETKLTHYPVINPDGKFAGIITIEDLLIARSKESLRDRGRERVLRLRWPFVQPVREEDTVSR